MVVRWRGRSPKLGGDGHAGGHPCNTRLRRLIVSRDIGRSCPDQRARSRNFKFAVCRFGDTTKARAIRTAPGSPSFLFARISRRLVSWRFNHPPALRARRYVFEGDARCRNNRVRITSLTCANGLRGNRLRGIAATALLPRANASSFCAPSPKLLVLPSASP
jgi:hypothetical protein